MVGFVSENDIRYAGKHMLVDLYGCSGDMNPHAIIQACEKASKAAGATVLFSHCHAFDGGGSSGAVILAESHCTYHHWWEDDNFIAIDLFVCGNCDPYDGLPTLLDHLKPSHHIVKCEKRGIIDH